MARPKTATSLLEARGAFLLHPERKRAGEPVVTAPFRPEPPDHLKPDQAACWREVVGMVPAGVLTGADHIIVEIVCCLLTQFRRDPDEFLASRLTRLTSEMSKIGLSPSARAGLVVAPAVPANDPWAEFRIR